MYIWFLPGLRVLGNDPQVGVATIRPRFSIRTLLILVTLIGLYLGCWELTKIAVDKRQLSDEGYALALNDLENNGRHEEWESLFHGFDSSPAPFIVHRKMYVATGRFDSYPVQQYYVWFFGYTAKLYERRLEPDPPLGQPAEFWFDVQLDPPSPPDVLTPPRE